MAVGSLNLGTLGALGGSNVSSLLGNVVVPEASSGASLFGDASILSLGSGAASSTGYTDLSGILTAAFSNSNPSAVSAPKISKAEAAALEKAFNLLEAGDTESARASLNDILSKNRNNGAAIQALGLIKLSEGDADGAAQLFRRADFVSPNSGYDVDAENAEVLVEDDAAVLERANQLVSSGQTRSKGIELLLRLTDRSPDNAEAQLLLGKSLLSKNKIGDGIARVLAAIDSGDDTLLREVESEFAELSRLAPKIPEYRGVLARARIRLGDYETALRDLEAADALTNGGDYFRNDRIAALVGVGRQKLDNGELLQAISTLRDARNLDPTNENANAALAEALLTKGEQSQQLGGIRDGIRAYDEAARILGRAGDESLRRRLAGRAYEAGVRYHAQSVALGRDVDLEVLAFQAAYNVDSDNSAYKRRLAETRSAIGDQYFADGKYEAAAGAYQRARDLYKGDETYKDNLITAWRARGDELLTQKRYNSAITAFKKAYDVDTSDATSAAALANGYNERGLDYQTKGKFNLAVLDFKEALRLQPENAGYQSNYDALRGYDV